MHLSTYNAAVLAMLAPAALANYLKASGIAVEKTTTLENGQVIDWIDPKSQGDIASAPPYSPKGGKSNAAKVNMFSEHTAGPKGTVPVLRSSGKEMPRKQPPAYREKPSSRIDRRQFAGKHWYASSAQGGDNHGSSGTFSMFKAYVETENDFSLLQTAVERNGVPNVGGSGLQTVEAGWINYPSQRPNPHLFTFFTANGHGDYGDNVCSWNTDYAGWVQVDNTYYPGMEMQPLSVPGGEEHELSIQFDLFEGNWWFGVNNVWIGYYPANLFSRDGNGADITLESKSDQVNWYGEIAQSEDGMTTTDMGSGHFANEGRGQAAYIRNMQVIGTDGNAFDYDGSGGVIVDDDQRYSIDTHFKSGEEWGSYFYVGGPGAGGVIGG